MIYVVVLNCESGICEIYPFQGRDEAIEFAETDDRVEGHNWMITEKIEFT